MLRLPNLLGQLSPKVTPLTPHSVPRAPERNSKIDPLAECQTHNGASTPTPPTTTLSNDQPTQKVAPANANDPVTTNRSLLVQELVTLQTRSEVKAILRREKASSSLISMGFMPMYPSEATTTPYPPRYKVPKF